ncbi:MAG: PcfJ domain-containing protein [Faecousia sp.]
MDKEWMRRRLPEKAPDGYEEWILREAAEELDVDLMLFSAERVKVYPELKECMTPEDYRPIKSIWRSRCTCTVCGEDFITRYVNSGVKGFVMYQGEDGCLYPVDPVSWEPDPCSEIEDMGYDSRFIELSDGDGVVCPLCFANVEVLHRSKLRGGRTRQILGCTVQNISGYTAIIYWLTAKRIDPLGYYTLETYPRDAYVIGEKGGLTRYRHTGGTGTFVTEFRLNEWTLCQDAGRDSASVPYRDWTSNCNKKVGGFVWRRVPDLEGCTGEKTGLAEYIQQGGQYPVTYLKIWKQHKSIENLVKAGWGMLIERNIDRYTTQDARCLSTEIRDIDLTKKKPHEMLRMTKADFRALSLTHTVWRPDMFGKWAEYKIIGGSCSALEFEKYYRRFGEGGTDALIDLMRVDEKADFQTVAAYMEKQNLSPANTRLLVDAREMAEALHPERELTAEERWPRHLMAVHDRLDQMIKMEGDPKKNRELDAGFRAVVEAYGCLEWNDGELRILLPRSNAELVREGNVLRHCVGGYGQGHCEGRLIFFVRKYRRPERSYYTLNIDMTRGQPNEIQLHGYGNEHHGKNKEYTHKIPQKVRDFVDRWKKEVLMPWWLRQIQNDKKEKTA